jgi:sec-independent protein translocase protein TatA
VPKALQRELPDVPRAPGRDLTDQQLAEADRLAAMSKYASCIHRPFFACLPSSWPGGQHERADEDDGHNHDGVKRRAKALYVHPTLSREGKDVGSFSLTHWLVVLAIILILFGAGKLPRVMGDFAKGIKNFKAGMKDDDDLASSPAKIEDAGEVTDRKA